MELICDGCGEEIKQGSAVVRVESGLIWDEDRLREMPDYHPEHYHPGHEQDALKALEAIVMLIGDQDLPDNGELSGAAICDQARAAIAWVRKEKGVT